MISDSILTRYMISSFHTRSNKHINQLHLNSLHTLTHMFKNLLHRYPLWARYVTGVLMIVFAISLAVFIDAVSDVRHDGKFWPRDDRGGMSVSGEGGFLTSDDISKIEWWMSFEYVNFAFHIPPEYFRDTLGIDDKKYPRIALRKYAKEQGKDVTVFVQDIRTLVGDYLTTHSLPR